MHTVYACHRLKESTLYLEAVPLVMTLELRAKALEAQNKSLTHRGSPDLRVLAWIALKSGDPLLWASRALAHNPNVMTRGAASTKSILLACGKRIRNDLGR